MRAGVNFDSGLKPVILRVHKRLKLPHLRTKTARTDVYMRQKRKKVVRLLMISK